MLRLRALIPARGGSKRIPKKNIALLDGKPLLQYTWEAAQRSRIFEEIVVSTEDKEIEEIARNLGATILQRPEHLSTDTARVLDVANHYLDLIKEEIDFLFILLPTSPLRTEKDIINVFDILKKENNLDGVTTVTPMPFSPIYALSRDDKGFIKPVYPKEITKKTQFAPQYYVDNGSIYAYRPSVIRKYTYFTERVVGYVMPFIRSIDIDKPEDLELAEVIIRYLKAERKM